MQVYRFSDGMIYQVYAAPGAVTDIALQPGENLVAVAAGGTVRWVIGDTTSGTGAEKRTHILVNAVSEILVAGGVQLNRFLGMVENHRLVSPRLLVEALNKYEPDVSLSRPGSHRVPTLRSISSRPLCDAVHRSIG